MVIYLAASLHLQWRARAKVTDNDNNASSNLEIHLFLNGSMLNWCCSCSVDAIKQLLKTKSLCNFNVLSVFSVLQLVLGPSIYSYSLSPANSIRKPFPLNAAFSHLLSAILYSLLRILFVFPWVWKIAVVYLPLIKSHYSSRSVSDFWVCRWLEFRSYNYAFNLLNTACFCCY